jgi:hypothetical protein
MIYSGDIGQLISIDTLIDLSEASSTQFQVSRPDGSIVIWNNLTISTGSTGLQSVLTYVTRINDLGLAGEYKLQPYIVTPSFNGHTATAYIQVNQLFT